MADDYMAEVEREISAFFLAAERTQARRVLPEVGRLEKTAFHLLGELVEQGPSRPSAVAHLIRLDLSTVSRQVRALEDLGFVARTPDPDDRRASVLEPTPAGRALVAEVKAAFSQLVDVALAGWSERDRRTLTTLLGRLGTDMRPDRAPSLVAAVREHRGPR